MDGMDVKTGSFWAKVVPQFGDRSVLDSALANIDVSL